MTDSYIALTETRLNKAHVVSAATVIGLVLVVSILAIPYGSIALGPNSGFLPAFGSLTCMGDLITCLLLFTHAKALNDKSYAWLGGAYLFSFLIIIPHLLAFPGVFYPTSLIGTSASAVWLWVAWHGGFALAVINFTVRKSERAEDMFRTLPIIVGFAAVVAGLALIATIGEPLLPTILVNGSYARLTSLGIAPVVVLCSVVALVLVAVQLRNASVLTIWLTVAMIASLADVCLTLLGAGRFTLGWYLARCLSLIAGFAVLTALLTDFIRLFDKVATANQSLEKLSLTDALTEISNRRAFEQVLDKEWRRAVREQLPLSLIMIDIDNFKRYNDRFGHPAGDTCLRDIAAAISGGIRRPWDTPARLGGEEFAVILAQTEADGAWQVAEGIRAKIEHLALPHPDNTVPVVTISVGIETIYPYAPGATQEALIKAADIALYAAKTGGRNRVSQRPKPVLQGVIEALHDRMIVKI